jgi:hypothetical protein
MRISRLLMVRIPRAHAHVMPEKPSLLYAYFSRLRRFANLFEAWPSPA